MSASTTTAQSCGGVGNNVNSATSTTTCHNFIANTWRKEICSNCFRLRDEHNSVKDLLIGRNNGTTAGAMNTQSSNSTATSNNTSNQMLNKPRYQSPYASSASGRERSPNNVRNSIPRVSPARESQSGRISTSVVAGKSSSPSRDAYGMTSRVSYLQTSNSSSNIMTTNTTGRMKHHGPGSSSSSNQGTSHYYTSSQTNNKVSHPQQASSELKKSTNANAVQYGNGSGSGSGGLVSVNGVTVSGSALSGSISYGKSANSVKQVSNKNLLATAGGVMEGGATVPDGRKPKFTPQGKIKTKGILKSKEAKPRRMNVTFPEKVVEVIGYGGEPKTGRDSSDESDDDLLTPLDPQDNSSITEILEKNSTTSDEKEFNRLTQKNTNFNSIKTNLQGKTNIEIGPIVGCTGGKSMTANKPLISIGTFESRNEPLKIRKKDDDSVVDGFRKIAVSKKETSQMQTTASSTGGGGGFGSSNANTANSKITKNDGPIARATGGGVGVLKTTSFNPTTTSIPSGSNASKELSKPKNETTRRSQSPDFSQNNKTQQPSQPKSILKSTSQFTSSSSQSSIVTSGNPIKSSLKATSNISASSASSGLTNLIILTEGNTITQKRTSFLREKAVDLQDAGSSGKSTSSSFFPGGNQKITSDSNGVTVVNTGSLVASEVSLDLKDSLNEAGVVNPPKPLERTKVKVNLKEKLSHPIPFSSSCDSASSGSGGDSEFDDSLEDSGLDIGKSSSNSKVGVIMESNNKGNKEEEACGSSSDSGNENDYILEKNSGGRNSSSNNNKGTSKGGLFISVDEEIKSDNKANPAKLSPDSVLFPSDVSEELSHGGSVESLSSVSLEVEEIVPQAAMRKRTAPRPPPLNSELLGSSEIIDEDLDDEEGESFYDDVSTIKDKNEDEDVDEESLYDDCSAMQGQQESNNKIQGGPACGSYDFQSSNGSNDDQDLIPTRPDGGVEFKGMKKIDSESFLRERSPSPVSKRWSSNSSARERSSSTSPKPTNRKRVNQFFSTLGKKAGAAFSSSHLTGSRNKSPVTFNPSGSSCGGSDRGDSPAGGFGRSQSTDEVTRTQEIYATITPTSMKFKGLAPVLHKLSKIDLNLNNHSSKGGSTSSTPTEGMDSDSYEEGGQNKLFKKHGKISMGIKKFLRIGKEGSSLKGNSSDSSSPTGGMTISAPYFERSHTSCSSVEDGGDSSFEDGKKTPDKLKEAVSNDNKGGSNNKAPPMGKPPPPPPRVHSLDLLHKVGIMGPHGTVGASSTKPARPPPPVRSNKVAPSFTSVFNNPNGESGVEISGTSLSLEDLIPPSKPKRKNSSVGRQSESPSSHDCHIAHLNLETLKLIANQSLTKISRSRTLDTGSKTFSWSSLSFPSLEPKPSCSGSGFAIYFPAFVQGEDESVCVLIQECTSAPGFSAPFQFSCVKTEATFEDTIPMEFVSWNASDYVKTERGIKGMVSILPPLSLRRIQDFVKSPDISSKEKNLALLQATSFWGSSDLEDLVVIKSMSSFDAGSVLYVHPTPQLSRCSKRSSSSMWNDFENEMKQLLLATGEVLSPRDRSLLIEKLVGAPDQIQKQLRLFFQLKLFVPSRESPEFVKITKEGQVEEGLQKWLDKERALCMKDAVERSMSRDGNSITPYKKAYLEFLVHSGVGGGSANQISKDVVTLFNDIYE